MELFEYEVRPGFYHGAQRQYGPGDRVVLSKAQAAAFDDKLKLVGPAKVAEPEPEMVAEPEPEMVTDDEQETTTELESKPVKTTAARRGSK
jgi:hypothetical protein